jgi:hypothetical protein
VSFGDGIARADLKVSVPAFRKLELDAENKTLRQDIKHIDQFKTQIAYYEENQRLW